MPFVISHTFSFIKSPFILTEFLHIRKPHNVFKTLALMFHMIYMNKRSVNLVMLIQVFFPWGNQFFLIQKKLESYQCLKSHFTRVATVFCNLKPILVQFQSGCYHLFPVWHWTQSFKDNKQGFSKKIYSRQRNKKQIYQLFKTDSKIPLPPPAPQNKQQWKTQQILSDILIGIYDMYLLFLITVQRMMQCSIQYLCNLIRKQVYLLLKKYSVLRARVDVHIKCYRFTEKGVYYFGGEFI